MRNLKDDIDVLEEYLQKRIVEDKFTGTVTLTLHCNNGGIGRIKANVDHDLKRKENKK